MRSSRQVGASIVGGFFDARGHENKPRDTLDTRRHRSERANDVSLIGSGQLVVAWQANQSVQGRLFGQDALPRSDRINLSATTDQASSPEISSSSSGDFVVVWSATSGGGQTSVLGRMFSERGAPKGSVLTITDSGPCRPTGCRA